MQKKSITNKITPCCNLPFSVMHWWLTNIPLNSEADREFLFSKLNQNGSLTKEAWIVLVNSGTLELDSSLTKIQFLDILNCKGKLDCNELKLIIEGFRVGNYNPLDDLSVGWTEANEFEQYNGKTIKKITGYFGGIGEIPAELQERIGKFYGNAILTLDKDLAIDFKPNSQAIVVATETLAELAPQINYNAGSIALVYDDENPKYNGFYKKNSGVGMGGWEFTDSVGFLKKDTIAIRKKTVAEIQSNINFEEDEIAIVSEEPNPFNNGIYKKISGIGSGGWEKTNFSNPLHHKKITATTTKDTESLAIGGGHTSIFQDDDGTGQGHTAFGFEAGLGIGNCWATSIFGWKAGRMLSNYSVPNTWTGLIGNTGNSLFGYNVASVANGMLDCSYFGTSAGQNSTTCMDNAGFGIWSLRLIEGGSENAGFGHLSLGYLIGKGTAENIDSLETNVAQASYSWGHRNVGVGDKAGALTGGGNPLNYVKKCVYIGAKTTGSDNFVVNENVFGYLATGLGSNTISLGNNEVEVTHHHGILASFCDRRVADLPTPSRFLLGARTHILDCTHRTFDLEAIGGGSNNMPVWCDGSVWRVG